MQFALIKMKKNDKDRRPFDFHQLSKTTWPFAIIQN